jgi:hypothetical protein
MRLSLDGGSLTTLASSQASPYAIAVSGGTVYWTNEGTPGPAIDYADGTVMAVDLDSGVITTLVSPAPSAGPIAVNSTGVYWEDRYGVRRFTFDGGNVATMADAGWFLGIAANDKCVYLVDRGTSISTNGCIGGMIESLPK